MVLLHVLDINPPLLNSSCAWSSNLQQLTELYESPYTGAVTTRTATLLGFKEDNNHTVAFHVEALTTINSYGYSPHPLTEYIEWVKDILISHPLSTKPIIISITASDPQTLAEMVNSIQTLREVLQDGKIGNARIGIELTHRVQISPIPHPRATVSVLTAAYAKDNTLTIGLKLPPYVHKDQFAEVFAVLQSLQNSARYNGSAISFLTCTNTLGNSLLFSEQSISTIESKNEFAVPTGLGGLAGESLHPLALGNVYAFKKLISSQSGAHAALGNIKIIGVGGVTSKAAVERMTKAGADFVGCATLFGKEGVHAFEILGKR
ncbi:putative dihydroorotate dehydrogenase A (fumarate) [Psilocybe cubensis]|uniref:Dihydroorotate dehydrogenase A (Fumarate) n=1 Tax=Psilocybe cubensis TaxID=181762 RepID=A0ACB8HFK0_PSICU|nr:putative dihydroorotate dehydrogenase A (fumarate) [Psilocybe cubensis]KAH9486698.1 putative dihydroorotate dehydrogenase A (fumarate) [Psilocybe cubensis]